MKIMVFNALKKQYLAGLEEWNMLVIQQTASPSQTSEKREPFRRKEILKLVDARLAELREALGIPRDSEN